MSYVTVIDFEVTASRRGQTAKPWQVGIVQLQDGKISTDSCFHSYLRVEENAQFHTVIPSRAERDLIQSSGEFSELLPALLTGPLNHPLAAHHAAVERNILRRYAPLHDFSQWIDSLTLTRKIYPQMESYALSDIISALGLGHIVSRLCPDLAPHHALYDAVSCAVLLEHLHELSGVLTEN